MGSTTGETSVCPAAGGVTFAKGFRAGSLRVPVKNWNKPDLAILVSDTPCAAAGVFTTNRIKAASVVRSKKLLPATGIRAVVVNSGNANACTGARGRADNHRIAATVAAALGCPQQGVLSASTGVIGRFLPVDAICAAIPALVPRLAPTPAAGRALARAIMTTDTVIKQCAVVVTCGKREYRIGGCSKGSGMIHPNMATMLAFLTTDAAVDSSLLNGVVKRVAGGTFNNLTIDGDTSTNDLFVLLANGASGATVTTARELAAFEEGVFAVCDGLCGAMAADGEGATRHIRVTVSGATSTRAAARTARAVASSNLVKTAVFGCDPNWGRIVCAIGYSGSRFSPARMRLSIGGIEVFVGMRPSECAHGNLVAALRKKTVPVDIDLGLGEGRAVSHTCDLTYDYIRINAEYTT